MKVEPEALLGVVDLSDKAQLQLPDVFRYWQMHIATRNDTLKDFIDYLISLRGSSRGSWSRISVPALSENGRAYNSLMHEATIMSIVANLGSIVDYFDEGQGRMVGARDMVVPGRCTVIDVSREPQGRFQSLIIRHLLLEVLRYQKERRERGEKLCPVIFAIDEAHIIYSSRYKDLISKEISMVAKTGRSLKCGLILASQLVSDLPSDILRLAGSKVVFRVGQRESEALGFGRYANILENLKPGFCLFQDSIKIRGRVFTKVPRAPCKVISG